jgi:hypothetical protein
MTWGDIKDIQNTTKYKGFWITPCCTSSMEDGASEKWHIAVAIRREGGSATERVFTEKGRSAPNEEEAIRLSREYASKIIDGLVLGESVIDL